MRIYAKYVLPRLLDLAMRNKPVMRERETFVPLAFGTVLEVGIGSGLNIPFYARTIEKLCGLDPSPELQKMAHRRATTAPFPIELVEGSGEDIPRADGTFDTVVTTWTLCTIPNPVKALREMARVLKAGGQLIFIEHGRSPDPGVLAWQNRLNPLWNRFAGGCHLHRKIDDLIVEAGFHITRLEAAYGKGPKPFTFLYKGVAQPNAVPGGGLSRCSAEPRGQVVKPELKGSSERWEHAAPERAE